MTHGGHPERAEAQDQPSSVPTLCQHVGGEAQPSQQDTNCPCEDVGAPWNRQSAPTPGLPRFLTYKTLSYNEMMFEATELWGTLLHSNR